LQDISHSSDSDICFKRIVYILSTLELFLVPLI